MNIAYRIIENETGTKNQFSGAKPTSDCTLLDNLPVEKKARALARFITFAFSEGPIPDEGIPINLSLEDRLRNLLMEVEE